MKTSFLQNTWSNSRLSFVSAWRRFNTSLDFVFYDIGALSAHEREEVSNHTSPLGEILVVHPRRANTPLQHYTSLEFVQKQKAATDETVSTLVVAGVGSSALGTACLARDIADYLGKPVAGIVSGFGLADVMTEALGGWFVFGAANALRDGLARTLQSTGIDDHVRHQKSHEAIKKHFKQQGLNPEFFIYGNPASTALLFLLSELGPKIKVLVGHSKGNYCIENALEGLHQLSESSGRTSLVAHLQIVTLGAVIWFDPEFTRLRQFIGQIDLLGMLNSRSDVSFEMVPRAWHSLNRMLLGHLAVAQALKAAGVPHGGAPASSPETWRAFRNAGPSRDGSFGRPAMDRRTRGSGSKRRGRTAPETERRPARVN